VQRAFSQVVLLSTTSAAPKFDCFLEASFALLHCLFVAQNRAEVVVYRMLACFRVEKAEYGFRKRTFTTINHPLTLLLFLF
jgi:hypothetical protein